VTALLPRRLLQGNGSMRRLKLVLLPLLLLHGWLN
jgi:hypothetical protein